MTLRAVLTRPARADGTNASQGAVSQTRRGTKLLRKQPGYFDGFDASRNLSARFLGGLPFRAIKNQHAPIFLRRSRFIPLGLSLVEGLHVFATAR